MSINQDGPNDNDPRDMTDAELADEITVCREEVRGIEDQLRFEQTDPFPRGAEWKARAGNARRYRLKIIRECEAEAKRRGLMHLVPAEPVPAVQPAVPVKNDPIRQTPGQLTQAQTMAAAVRKAEIRRDTVLQLKRLELERLPQKADMFVKAAHRVLSKDQIEAIWERAQEMFPGHVCWEKGVPLKIVRDESAA